MTDDKKFDFFNYDACELCGQCLLRCQYMDLNQVEAEEEMRRLVNHEPTRIVHDKCASCYACDTFCPNDCHPYELILSTWYKRYKQKGLPVRTSYLLPGSEPNFRTDAVERFTSRDKELYEKWTNTAPEGEFVIYPGCNALTLPHLLDLEFLCDIPVSGNFDLCCGEMYYRMGLFDVVEKTARKLTEYYRHRHIGTMLFICPAGLNMFRNVLPKQFGAEFAFKTMYLGDYLLEKIQSGALEIKSKLSEKVAVHDSCHGRVLGDEVMETTRKLYDLMGLEMEEMEYNREDGLCCGMAAGCRRYRPEDIYSAAARELGQARRTRAEQLAVYCGGCHMVFSMMGWLQPGAVPVRHLMEYLAQALASPQEKTSARLPASKRSLRILGDVAWHTLPKLLSRKSYKIK